MSFRGNCFCFEKSVFEPFDLSLVLLQSGAGSLQGSQSDSGTSQFGDGFLEFVVRLSLA